MAQTIKLKRKTGATGAPATTDLELGELAINAFDGKLYLKKDNGAESIVEVGGGSLTLDDVTTNGNTTTNAITVGGFTSTGIDDNATTTQFTLSNSEATFGALLKSSGGYIVTGTSYGIISNGQFTSVGIDDNATQTALTIDSNEISYFSTGTVGSSPTETVINRWAASSDIDGLLPGSTSGPIIEGGWQSHLVLGIRDNDVNDGVYIVSGSGNYATDSTYDKVVASFKADGKVGIGTSTPTDTLEVNGRILTNNNIENQSYTLTRTSGTGDTGNAQFILADQSNSQFVMRWDGQSASQNPSVFSMYSDASGSFLFSYDPAAGGTQFELTSQGGTSPYLFLEGGNATNHGELLLSNTGFEVRNLPTSTETTALMISSADVVSKRTLGSNAFNSTAFTTNTGTVTSVAAGNGLDFTSITTTGSVTLGTPSTLTASTTNATTATSHTHAITGFVPLTGSDSLTGGLSTTGTYFEVGRGSGSVAMTTNDGDGNANLTFNHRNGDADVAGNVGRIEVNVDSTTGATMYFEVQDNAATGAITINNTGMTLTRSSLTINNNGTAGGGALSAGTLTLTGLSNQASEATALMINGSNVVGTRELGSNAFNSTAFTTNTGTVTSVAAGNGLDFTSITTTGSVTLGTPGSLTAATTNAVTATSHTHAVTGFLPSTSGTMTELGTNAAPATDDLFVSGYGIMGTRAASPIYVTNTGAGGVQINVGGVHGAANKRALFTSTGLDVTGAITATGNITAYSSDARLKLNQQPIQNAVEKVISIGGYSFDWNMDKCEEHGFKPVNPHEHGVMAQEIQKVIPDAISAAPFDLDEEGNSKSGEDYLSVNYERIVPLLIEAIKEQQAQIDELKEMINGTST